jgi:hypothetical protein
MSQSFETILASCNMSPYGFTLEQMGYVDVLTLASMNLDQLQCELQMLRGNARQLYIALQSAAASAAEPKCEEPLACIDSEDNAAGCEEQMRDSSPASDYDSVKEEEQEHAGVGGLVLARVGVASDSHAAVADGLEVRYSSPARSNLRPDGRGRTAERAKVCRRECSRIAAGRRGSSQELCRLFVRYNCKWGDRCKFAHDTIRARQEAQKWIIHGVGFSNATACTKTGHARAKRSENAIARRFAYSQLSRSCG